MVSKQCYTYEGVKYASLKAFCDTYDIRPNILYTWSKAQGGVDAEHGLSEFMSYYKNHGYTDHNNMTYKKLKDMAKAWNVPYTVLKERLSMGWDTQKALTTPSTPSKKRVEYRGKEYSSVRSLCFELGIQQPDVYSYKTYHKCDLTTAVDYYVAKREKRLKALETINEMIATNTDK